MFKFPAALAAIVLAGSAQAAVVVPYTVATAPDAISRSVLARPLKRIDEGASPQSGADMQRAIHANFPQIVEQNFAHLDAAGARKLVDNLSERELHDLAQLYVNAVNDSGRQGALLDVLADRLDVKRLARVSKHFGTNEVAAAVQRSAPMKSAGFAMAAPALIAAPMAGALLEAPVPRVAAESVKIGTGLGRFLNMTPYEIYLDFRTAPVGALDVTGALFETSVIVSLASTVAWEAGQYVGSDLNGLIQTYDPTLYDAIGGTLHGILDPLIDAVTPAGLGSAEQYANGFFNTPPEQTRDFAFDGGDFGATEDWEDSLGGGGGLGTCGDAITANCFTH